MSHIIKDGLIILGLWFALSIGTVAVYIVVREAVGARHRRRIARIGYKVFYDLQDGVKPENPSKEDSLAAKTQKNGGNGNGEAA